MNDTAEFLNRLALLDIRLAVEGERLRLDAPKGAISAELREELERRKEEVIAHCRSRSTGTVLASALAQVTAPVRVPRQPGMPVSHMQQRLWFLRQTDPESFVYNIPAAMRLTGPLNLEALKAAIAAIVDRHESLRLRFETIDDEPRCTVEDRSEVMLEIIDLGEVQAHERELAMLEVVRSFTQNPFDIGRAPLLHAGVIRLSRDEHVFVFVLDHLVADGLSIGIFLMELQAHYAHLAEGAPLALPEIPIQYLDHAQWERQRYALGELAAHVAFWKRRLAGLPAALQLPTDRPRPPIQTSRGARIAVQVPSELSERVRAFGRQEGVTLFMVLLAAFEVLLHRHSGEEDIAIGTAVANRTRPEVEHLIGFFANNLVLRSDLSGRPTVRELLARVRATALEAYAHQEMPFDLLVEVVGTRRALDRSPLFQVMFVLQRLSLAGIDLPKLHCDMLEIAVQSARFDLAVDVFELPAGLRVYFEYNTDLFDAASIERMAEHYVTLLEGFVARPTARIDELTMVSEAEGALLLHDWNRTEAGTAAAGTVHLLFESQVERTPQSVAVSFEEEMITYRELNARANRLARHLRSLGVGPESLVGVLMERSVGMVVALLGILKAGGAYVPLDPAFPKDRIDYMISDAGLTVAVTHGSLATMLPVGVHALCIDRDAAATAQWPSENLTGGATPENLAYVIYTSGSTGRPKGVEVEHRSVVNFLGSMHDEPGLDSSDRFVSVTTLSFDIAGLEIHGPLTCGGTVVLASRETTVDGKSLAALLERSDATVLQGTPATWRLLLDCGWRGKPGLKMLCGGEGLPRDLAQQLLATGGELWNMYGPTETTIWSTVSRVRDVSREVPIGRPIANTQVYVLEPSGLLAPIGVGGELCIGGTGLARGYHNRADLTAEKFVTLDIPGLGRRRVYRTGDIVRFRADGQLVYMGRRDHQVKVRGFRIELGEIEAVLASHEAVRHCVVVAREASPGDARLVAYVVYRPGEEPTVSELRRYLRRSVPDYMVPSVIVALESIPLLANGKTNRAALPDPFRDAKRADADVEPPAPGMEELLAGIWRDLLKVDRVGAQDNFFELGGHSLLALRVASAVERRTGWRMDPRAMFFQSLRQVAAAHPGTASADGKGAR